MKRRIFNDGQELATESGATGYRPLGSSLCEVARPSKIDSDAFATRLLKRSQIAVELKRPSAAD
jgi:hypothetical protein